MARPSPLVDPSSTTPDPTGVEARASTVFIVGAARSGTSLLYKALCLHPDAAYISNWVARFPRLPGLATLNRLARRFPTTRGQVWFGPESNAYVYGSRRPLRHRVFPMPVEGEPVYTRCGVARPGSDPVAPGPRPEDALPRVFSMIRGSAGGSCFLSKRIANNLRIPLLARSFPGARFVELVRDGRAVAHSLSRVDWWDTSHVWWYGGTPRQWREEGRDPWEICARNWVEELREIATGLQAVPAPQVHRLSYEDLVGDPIERLEGVAEFLGLPASSAWTAALDTLRFPDRNEAWRDRLDEDIVERITSIQLERLRDHGYEV